MRLHPDEQAVANEYAAAFGSVYPQRQLNMKPAGREVVTRQAKFRVEIDGDGGDPLTIDQLRSATSDFLRGRRV